MLQVILILLVAAFVCAGAPDVQAQQTNTPTFNNTYENAVAKARATCKALWSDHVLDPLRDKIPLGEEKPTFAMLKNNEKLKVKDRPIKHCWSRKAPASQESLTVNRIREENVSWHGANESRT